MTRGTVRGIAAPIVVSMKKDHLEGYLADQAAEGRHDGSSEVTISVESALRKMAVSQLPFPEAWILKIIQAVVSSGESSAMLGLGPAA